MIRFNRANGSPGQGVEGPRLSGVQNWFFDQRNSTVGEEPGYDTNVIARSGTTKQSVLAGWEIATACALAMTVKFVCQLDSSVSEIHLSRDSAGQRPIYGS